MTDRDGGMAFPCSVAPDGPFGGMTLRHYYRAHAPVTLSEVVEWFVLDKENVTRAELLRYMALIRDEYATAMLALDGNKEDE